MKSNCFLHVGLAKTGTTAIQEAAYLNSGLLRSHGILYPRTVFREFEHAHHEIAFAIERDQDPLNWIKPITEDLTEAASCGLDILLSSEAFFALFLRRPGIFLSFLDLLKSRMRISVLVSLRRDDYLLESLYLQELSVFNTRLPFVEWLEFRLPTISTVYFAIESLANYCDGRLLLVPYEEGKDIVSPFFGALGVNCAHWETGPAGVGNRVSLKTASALLRIGRSDIPSRLGNDQALELAGRVKRAFPGDFASFRLISEIESLRVLSWSEYYYQVLSAVHYHGRPLFDLSPISGGPVDLDSVIFSPEEQQTLSDIITASPAPN